MSTPPTNDAMEFDCPLCGGAFEASPEMLGEQVECPHCGQVVELPAAQEIAEEVVAEPEPTPTLERPEPEPESLSLSPPTPSVAPAPDPKLEPAPKPVRPLTRAERAAARKRFNLILAAVGGVILLLAFLVLASRS
jgi:endogenous inhibitor of DNA gyrase (YacG/DUF329 family)